MCISMYLGIFIHRNICIHRYVCTWVCMYIGMYANRMGMYIGVYVCMQDSGSVRVNPFHPSWSPSNVRSAPLTKRLRNTVGTAKTKADVALPIHGFFMNILGKGSEVSSKHFEVPAFALIIFDVPPSLANRT